MCLCVWYKISIRRKNFATLNVIYQACLVVWQETLQNFGLILKSLLSY